MDMLIFSQPVPDNQGGQGHIKAVRYGGKIVPFFDHVDLFFVFGHPLIDKGFKPFLESVGRSFGNQYAVTSGSQEMSPDFRI